MGFAECTQCFFFFRAGKIIVLKDEDTDVESNRRPRSFRKYPRKTRKGPRSSGREAADANGTGSVITILSLYKF